MLGQIVSIVQVTYYLHYIQQWLVDLVASNLVTF